MAYLSSDQPYQGRLATCFEVLEELDHNPKLLRAWVREHRIGTLEIKKRGTSVTPEELRRNVPENVPE